MTSIEYLKQRAKSNYREFCELQKEQNELLDQLVEARNGLKLLQDEMNELQIAIEKLEQTP